MKLKLFVSALVAIFVLTGCGGNQDTPEQLFSDLEARVINNNTKDVLGLIYFPEGTSEEVLKNVERDFSENIEYENSKNGGIKSIKLSSIEYSEDKLSANVALLITYKNNKAHTEKGMLIKDNGQWKINYNF